MNKIQSKVFNYGDENESEWPPKYPEQNNSGRFYWDKEAQEFKEGNPPNPNNNFGEAPQVIFDSMPPRYHEGACRTIESRKEWESENKAHGMATFTSMDEPRKYIKKNDKEKEKALKKDRLNAAKIATEVCRSDPRAVRQKLNKQAEAQMDTLKKSGINLESSGIKIKD